MPETEVWQTIEALRERPELDADSLAADLSALVQTPSVNGEHSERAMAELVASMLQNTGAEITLVDDLLPGRPSVAAVLHGSVGEPRLVLNGHMDTVHIDDRSLWDVDPFGGAIKDGAVWGRGALDMKGGLATQIACARALSQLPVRPRGTLVLHFAAGEERGEPGTLSLLQAGFVGDYGITTEPTDLLVATAERGTGWFRIRLPGRSTHASTRQVGVNPNDRLAPLLDALARYDRELSAQSHPLLPSPTCTPTVIRAGVEHNAVPDFADVTVDLRLLPGMSFDKTRDELLSILRDVGAPDGTVEQHAHFCEPAEVPADSQFVELLRANVEKVTGQRTPVWGTPYSSDVRNLVNDAGIEAVTFGAGDVSQCHCPNERLAIADLQTASVALAKTTIDLLV